MPPAQVALSAGFFDQSHFTRIFRRYVGTAPSAYRQALAVQGRVLILPAPGKSA